MRPFIQGSYVLLMSGNPETAKVLLDATLSDLRIMARRKDVSGIDSYGCWVANRIRELEKTDDKTTCLGAYNDIRKSVGLAPLDINPLVPEAPNLNKYPMQV